MSCKMTGWELLESGKRFSVTMWEYSWLVQRSGRQSEYADWDKVLDELVERGYDCIRIDAQPHCIARDQNGKLSDQVTFLPISHNFMWGNHEEVTVNPRKSLVEFMKKVKDRGLYVGLSAWYNDDTEHRKFMLKSPQDYSRIWLETLDILKEAELLDIVVWVDICNEFPLRDWSPYPFEEMTGVNGKKAKGFLDMPTRRKWNEKQVAVLSTYFTESIKPIKTKYPELKYTFSFQGIGSRNFIKGDTQLLDIAEPHIWTTDDLIWSLRTHSFGALFGKYPDGLLKHARKSMKLYEKNKDKIYQILNDRMDFWAEWAKERKLPLITSEAWNLIIYEDLSHYGFTGEWDWFKEVAEVGVRLAIKKGWQGICTSNFAEPHFEGMWYDVEWHKKMTDLIRGN